MSTLLRHTNSHGKHNAHSAEEVLRSFKYEVFHTTIMEPDTSDSLLSERRRRTVHLALLTIYASR